MVREQRDRINLIDKIKEFKIAMDSYNNNYLYNKLPIVTAIIIIILQALSVFNLKHANINFITDLTTGYILVTFLIAYITTDFVNGLIHMYMDNNVNYKSSIGPLIAAFHLHHKQQLYKTRSALLVYFFETGSKFWLIGYMIILVFLQNKLNLNLYLNFFLVSFAILSSFAEVSHYWCHNSHENNFIISKLQKYRIILSKKHHRHHHNKDNVNYAFLNGMTDPLINIIAKFCYSGYKNSSDLHVMAYKGKQTGNRV